MSLAFAINAGPLSQVGLEIVSLSTAVQLATGVYGWFKGTERSQSLTQLFSTCGAELVATSTFNYQHYKDLRAERDEMQGVLVQNGGMKAIKLPKASTGISSLSGIDCLRALTCCLLYLVSAESTVLMLQSLIPYALLQLEREDASVEIEGPLLASLKQWVSTIALEEESNKLKDYVLEAVAREQSQMTGVPAGDIIREGDDFVYSESPFIIGVLKWILTPLHRRKIARYPTRSLRAWTAAAIMSKLGFHVNAAASVVNRFPDYEETMRRSTGLAGSPDVFLVTFHLTLTDIDSLVELVHVLHDTPVPQRTVVRAIPWLSFRHVGAFVRSPGLSVRDLATAYDHSFISARNRFQAIHVDNFQIKIDMKISEPIPFLEHYRNFFSPFSPHIYLICADAMPHFGPTHNEWFGWDSTNFNELLKEIRMDDDDDRGSRRHLYQLIAIMLGAIYGVCSGACFADGTFLSDHSEIAFNPDLLYKDGCAALRRWATALGRALEGGLDYTEWTLLLFELFAGATGPTGPTNRRNTTPNLTLGVQSHGFSIISDVLVRLRIQPEALGYFHIARGQLLNLPCNDEGYVQGSTHLPYPAELAIGSNHENMEVLYRFDNAFLAESTRIDVEPCWEAEPRAVILRMRQMGSIIASLNINTILTRLSLNVSRCSCIKHSGQIGVPASEKWYHLHLDELSTYRFATMKGRRADLDKDVRNLNFLINASQCEDASTYVLGLISAQQIVIAKDCLECAYRDAKRAKSDTRCTIIIPYNNKIKDDTTDQISERERLAEEKREQSEKASQRFNGWRKKRYSMIQPMAQQSANAGRKEVNEEV